MADIFIGQGVKYIDAPGTNLYQLANDLTVAGTNANPTAPVLLPFVDSEVEVPAISREVNNVILTNNYGMYSITCVLAVKQLDDAHTDDRDIDINCAVLITPPGGLAGTVAQQTQKYPASGDNVRGSQFRALTLTWTGYLKPSSGIEVYLTNESTADPDEDIEVIADATFLYVSKLF